MAIPIRVHSEQGKNEVIEGLKLRSQNDGQFSSQFEHPCLLIDAPVNTVVGFHLRQHEQLACSYFSM